MLESDTLLKKRLLELAELSRSRGIYTFSDFLSPAEQALFDSLRRELAGSAFSLFGGHPACERQMIRFGSEEETGYDQPFPICCVEIAPKNGKFSDALTHRDFLGAAMHLGVRREVLGDLFVRENTGILFSKDTVAPFLAETLETVRHTPVVCRILETCPESLAPKLVPQAVNVPSERADAVIGAVYRLSRSESARLFAAERVFVNSRTLENPGHALHVGDIVSVRGFGKFCYRGKERETKKGRSFVLVERYA